VEALRPWNGGGIPSNVDDINPLMGTDLTNLLLLELLQKPSKCNSKANTCRRWWSSRKRK